MTESIATETIPSTWEPEVGEWVQIPDATGRFRMAAQVVEVSGLIARVRLARASRYDPPRRPIWLPIASLEKWRDD